LSRSRASTVRMELIRRGISSYRLTSDGKGFTQPVANNATEAGRAQNRRVEIELTKGEL